MEKQKILKDKTILYVEDDRDTVEIFTLILTRFAKQVHTAPNGKEGLLKFRELKPDIVITDIEMPIMDGIELLEAIKSESPNTPVLIITAFRDEAHNATKADAVLIKPINRVELQKVLEEI